MRSPPFTAFRHHIVGVKMRAAMFKYRLQYNEMCSIGIILISLFDYYEPIAHLLKKQIICVHGQFPNYKCFKKNKNIAHISHSLLLGLCNKTISKYVNYNCIWSNTIKPYDCILWPSYALCRHKYGSTLALVMACVLPEPMSIYHRRFALTFTRGISQGVSWTESVTCVGDYIFKSTNTSPRDQ